MSRDDPRNNPRNNPRTDEDQQLVAKIATGDGQAFETLFQEYGERVFRYACRLISDAQKAEEVTNDVMMQVWKNAAKFEGRSKVSTWILGITRHVALNAVRGKKLATQDIDQTAPIADEAISAEVEKDREQLKAGLRSALVKLSVEHRDVIELTFFHDCSYKEIAEIVGCPENTVKTRMFHAKKQLQGILSGQNLSLATVEVAS